MRAFISYAREDLPKVRDLRQALEVCDSQVWLDQEIGGGQAWWTEILREIRHCDVFVTVLSSAYQQSLACKHELQYAVSLNRLLLPVRVGDVSIHRLPPTLTQLNIVDFSRLDSYLTGVHLARALLRMSDAPPLPDPLPDEPMIPLTPLQELGQRIQAEKVDEAQQKAILFDLKEALSRSEDMDTALELAQTFTNRKDLLYGVQVQLKELLAGTPVTPTRTPQPLEHLSAEDEALDRAWGPRELRRILGRPEPTYAIITAMLDQLARKPGVRMSRSALGKGIDPSLGTISGALAALQRWLNSDFRKDYPKPFKITGGPAEDPTIMTESYYELPAPVAKTWLAVRAS